MLVGQSMGGVLGAYLVEYHAERWARPLVAFGIGDFANDCYTRALHDVVQSAAQRAPQSVNGDSSVSSR